MAEVKSLFKEFLSAIEPDTKAKSIAANSHIRPREFLQNDEDEGDKIQDSFLYGSYRRHTAIHDIKDVDIMLISTFDPDTDTPDKILKRLRKLLKSCYGEDNVLELNRRSIKVVNPLPEEKTDITLDILPAVEVNDGSGYLLVPDREQKEWVITNPRGHIQAISKANDSLDKKLVPMVKIMKAWWSYQSSLISTESNPKPRPKSFWLESLVLHMFDNAGDSWAERFTSLLEKISDAYPTGSGLPNLSDPGMPESALKTSMTLTEFETFVRILRSSLDLAKVALDDPSRSSSSKTWAQIFGEDFPIESIDEKQQYLSGKQYTLGDTGHIVNLKFPYNIRGEVRIYGELYRRNYDNKRFKIRYGSIQSNSCVRSGTYIRFSAWTNIKRPYEVYWRVVNTGAHAAHKKGLRGKPFLDYTGADLTRWEPTEYTGKHWMECFIVKNGIVVAASERFYVNITNPKWGN